MKPSKEPRAPSLPRVLFVTFPRAQCSIYESGQMILAALRASTDWQVESIEVQRFDEVPRTGYDVYAFNWHFLTMPYFDTKRVRELPGLKLAFVLEVLPNDPFPLTPRHFDAYCAIDPTLAHPDRNVFAFPRPLHGRMRSGPAPAPGSVPIIGSFGFATPGKRFDEIVRVAGQEFERAIVRLHLASASHGDRAGGGAHAIASAARAVAAPGIEVIATHDYLSDAQIVDWCAENTLNCFFYERNVPGLAATTDQAIMSGSPLLVSRSATFRHVHQYIAPWPDLSMREAIRTAGEGVRAMQRDWSREAFCARFRDVLRAFGVLPSSQVVTPLRRSTTVAALPRQTPPQSRRVMFVNHAFERCGIYQYGKSTFDALAGSQAFDFEYVEVADAAAFLRAAGRRNPAAIIYNYHFATMPWLRSATIHGVSAAHIGIGHEFRPRFLAGECADLFDRLVVGDPTAASVGNPRVTAIGRIVPQYLGRVEPPTDRPTIGSFGFGFPDKGFDRLATLVCQEFESARLRLRIPISDFADPDGAMARDTVQRCEEIIAASGSDVDLEVAHDFVSVDELLDFLAGNHLNAFLYDDAKDFGISSCIDLALAVRRPIAVSSCPMFRHVIEGVGADSVCVSERTLTQIMELGAAPCDVLRQRWTAARLRADYERVITELLGQPVGSKRPEPEFAR